MDELLAADIAPYVTLYHWDLPQALEDLGGWTNRDTAYRFADFTRVVHDRLGDRVGTWMTINEPWVAAVLGYGIGIHAPGRASAAEAFRASHHLLLAHGLGAQVLRDAGAGEIALTLNLTPVMTPGQVSDPDLVPSAEDAEAVNRIDCLINRQFLDPALRGKHPDPVLAIMERMGGIDHIHDGDLETINQPVDLLGINYYTPCVVRSEPGEPANAAYPGSEGIQFSGTHAPTTAMGWAIVPTGLSQLLTRLSRDYPEVGLLVTENGAAFDDVVAGRPRARRRQDRLLRGPPEGRARRDRGRGRPARLPGLVAAGQLRVGRGLSQALRDRARRLRDAATAAQGQRAVVPRGDPAQRAAPRARQAPHPGGGRRPRGCVEVHRLPGDQR
ncbi:hypothetical protein GCM10018952_30450 [Streptosporangium vulgare]